MAQMGFFDLSDRYASLDAKKDPLLEIDAVVPWEEFRPSLERIWRKPDADRKSRAGRKPIDAVLMFKALVLSALYNLSDDQIEYQIRDRLSFMRFLGLGLGDRVPDAKTVWLYRDALAQAGKVEELFGLFDGYLNRQGYIARGGQILDASIVPVPRNHNTRDENAAIKKGEVPEDWADKPAKRMQKDVDARWTKKHGKSHYGYKNHVNVDRKHKLVRRYHVSDAALHDSQAVDHLLMQGNTGSGVWADAAYRSEEMEAKLRDRKLKSHIQRKGAERFTSIVDAAFIDVLMIGRFCPKQQPNPGDIGGTVAVSKKAIVADAVLASGQAVDQEPADELCRIQRHGGAAACAFNAVILNAEGDTVRVETDQSAVGNGDPVGVTR